MHNFTRNVLEKETPLYTDKKVVNQFKSFLKSSVIKMDFLLKFSRNRESILLKKHLAYLMHLATYSKDPSNDWSSLLVQTL